MTDDKPLISAIIPAYNGAPFLADAVCSILNQTYEPVEIIVVDDGSTDDSVEVVRTFPEVRLFRQENLGVAVARNRGVQQARGSLIAFLDQDDRWTPDKLAVQVRHLQNRHDLAGVASHVRLWIDDTFGPPKRARDAWFEKDQPGGLLGAMLLRRSAFDEVGLFDSSYWSASDTAWLVRAARMGQRIEMFPEMLYEKRVHSGNESARIDHRLELLRAMRGAIRPAARRAA